MKWTSLIRVLVIAVSISGCASFRAYQPPENPEGSQRIDLSVADRERFSALQEPVAAWWNEFNDPELSGLIEQALKTNLDVRIAYANLMQARAIEKVAKYDRFPTVTANAGYARELNSRELSGSSSTPRVDDRYSAGLDATWELNLFGRVTARIEEQEALEAAALADLQQGYVSIAAEVARTYIELRGAQYRLNIAQRNASNQADSYELTVKLFDGGRGTSLDVARAKTQLDLTRSSVPILRADVVSAMNRLAVLTGNVPDKLREPVFVIQAMPSLPVTVAVGDVTSLLKRRPDIRSAERKLAARVAQYNLASSDLFPTVNLLGSLGFLATNLGSFGSSALAGSLGPSLSWRAFDLGRVRAQVSQSDARTQAALALYERSVLEALEETQVALVRFSGEEQRRATLQQAAASAKQAASLARQRFDAGVDGFIDVLDAERTLLQAENTLAESETASAIDLIAIYKALGGGWQVVQ